MLYNNPTIFYSFEIFRNLSNSFFSFISSQKQKQNHSFQGSKIFHAWMFVYYFEQLQLSLTCKEKLFRTAHSKFVLNQWTSYKLFYLISNENRTRFHAKDAVKRQLGGVKAYKYLGETIPQAEVIWPFYQKVFPFPSPVLKSTLWKDSCVLVFWSCRNLNKTVIIKFRFF